MYYKKVKKLLFQCPCVGTQFKLSLLSFSKVRSSINFLYSSSSCMPMYDVRVQLSSGLDTVNAGDYAKEALGLISCFNVVCGQIFVIV